jgi:cytochrome c oxidase assembly protein subunit 15
MFKRTFNKFKRFSFFTIINVYLVIIAGGVVRCTGSGMGCPDWPKCFGRWVPPTEISQLPDNYVELYSKGGHLSVEFNVYRTWTEYVNRLLGAFVGVFIFFALYFSLVYWNVNRRIFYYSLVAFLLVGFQGWLGAKVVSSNLTPYMVSIHMLVALVILIILLFAYALATGISHKIINNSNIIGKLFLIVGLMSLVQILIGTQVRQAVDVIAKEFGYSSRELWSNNLGYIFVVHRFFAYLVIITNGYLAYQLYKKGLHSVSVFIACLLIGEVLSGLSLTYFGMPAYIQPVHLVIATILFGVQFYWYSIIIIANRVKIQ